MSINNDILELKFEGNGISPNKVKASEIACLIQDFEKALLCTIKTEHPTIDTNEVLFTFDSIKNESIGLNFLPNNHTVSGDLKTTVVNSYLSLAKSISNNDFSNLTNETIVSLKSISKFSKKYNCTANFKHNGQYLTAINPDTEIRLNKTEYLKGDTTIYGELVDAGGDHPNIHIKINQDYTVIIDTDKQKAKELALRLYDQVGLKGHAKWDGATSKIIEFKLYEVLDYSAGNVKNTFSELKSLTSGYWDNFNTDDEINKDLLRD